MQPIRYPPNPPRSQSDPQQRTNRQQRKRQHIDIPDIPGTHIRLSETGQRHVRQRPRQRYRDAERIGHGGRLRHAQPAAAQQRNGHDASSYAEKRRDGADAYAAGGCFRRGQSPWECGLGLCEKSSAQQAIDDGHAQVGDEGVADHLAADPHRSDGADDRAPADKPGQWPEVVPEQIARALVFACSDQGVDDYHAGRGGHGDVHGRLGDGVVGCVAGGEHAIEQRHDDEAAAETEEHGADAGEATEQCKQEIEHSGRPGSREPRTLERDALAGFSSWANNVRVYANRWNTPDAQYFDQSAR